MKIVLLRVGVDSGSGGIQGPVFADGSFEFMPIPDNSGRGARTYGNTVGTKGKPLVTYFPEDRQQAMQAQAMHLNPEFETFTYGDTAPQKVKLGELCEGDILAFYAGLSGWDHTSAPGLYLVGYLVVRWAGRATDLHEDELRRRCGKNFYVSHEELFRQRQQRLVLVQGGSGSRLLRRAYLISTTSTDKAGQPLKVLSPQAQEIFGDFGGKVAIQRSFPRWVEARHVSRAKAFLESLP